MPDVKKIIIPVEIEFDPAAPAPEASADAFVTSLGLGEVVAEAAAAKYGDGGSEPGVQYTRVGLGSVIKDFVV